MVPAGNTLSSDAGGSDSRPKSKDNSSTQDDAYEYVEAGVTTDQGTIMPTPSSDFPGTWGAALHDTSNAVRQVISASKTFGQSIATSGLDKAGRSVSGALATTANRIALQAVDFSMQASGTDQSQLPVCVAGWLQGKKKLDAAKSKAKKAERARLERLVKRRLLERGEIVEASPSQAPSTASMRGGSDDDDDDLVMVPQGGAYKSSIRQSESRSTARERDGNVGEASDENRSHDSLANLSFSRQRHAGQLRGQLQAPVGESPYANSSDEEKGYFRGQSTVPARRPRDARASRASRVPVLPDIADPHQQFEEEFFDALSSSERDEVEEDWDATM